MTPAQENREILRNAARALKRKEITRDQYNTVRLIVITAKIERRMLKT